MNHPICALSTPPAAAGLGVIRLSGDGAIEIADRVFRAVRPAGPLAGRPGYAASFGYVRDGEGDIDECVALVFRAPHSYTGEDVVEFSCHGGPYLLQRTLRALLDAGAAPAGAGEFTRRAFVNGKLDLTRAEAVMSLIGAQGRLAAKTALAAREGALYRRLQQVRQTLAAANAQFAAYVDYPDDDIPELETPALDAALSGALQTLQTLLATYESGRVAREGIDTAIVGSPNVGKSTLMNRLAGCERSIVTAAAGTTRDVVEETVRLGDVLLRLADTAGIRAAGDEAEAIGIQRARDRMRQAALLLAVFDGSRPLSQDDRLLAEQAAGETTVAVINKADLPQRIDAEFLRARFGGVVCLSARSGDGLEALSAAVNRITGVAALDTAQPLLISERQRACAARARDETAAALEALRAGMTLDAVSVGVDGALAAILELTGERACDAVVDEVFARFCVGK